MHDLAVIIVSTDQADWLPACLPTVFARSGPISLDLVVVDNGSARATRDLVERDFPEARVLVVPNHGFAHANNEALKTVDARYVLFLNPDTELLDGTLAGLLGEFDARPRIGLAGVRQLDADGRVYPTMRRFPNVVRTLGDALGLDRITARPAALGERELVGDRYEQEFESDWTIGSFMLARREALAAVGGFDERFFVYSEEVDLCLRIRRAGWTIVHLPALTILHHGSTARAVDVRMAKQNAYAQLQYADKHFHVLHRIGYRAALLLRYGLRSLPPVGDARRRSAARAAAALVLGRADPPFGRRPSPPPVTEAAWLGIREAMQARGPGVIGATGGSGTRVVARIVQRGGMFIGADRNRSEDALDFAAFSDRWVNAFLAGDRSPELAAELRALVARQARTAAETPWGWKEPRSIYLLPLLDEELPGLRFLHLVRDGRDMAYSENQVQLRKHGDALLGEDDGASAALRSISLWQDVNLRAADYGEERLGSRYLRLRFEDLCADPAAGVGEILDFFGLAGDVERIAAEEVAAPETLGRWRLQDTASIAALEAQAGAALERFGYQSSSA